MAKVLTCTDWDSATQTCLAQVWADHSVWVDYLPTVEQANAVGFAFFASLTTVVVIKRLLTPPKH